MNNAGTRKIIWNIRSEKKDDYRSKGAAIMKLNNKKA